MDATALRGGDEAFGFEETCVADGVERGGEVLLEGTVHGGEEG
jgi:hypothetical protein